MYQIKVLDTNDFDSLPYEGIDNSLGIADVKQGKVFVRDTGIHELNKYLISHEIEHLVEERATHEDEHGIRHKKFFKEFLLPLFTGYNAQQKTWSPFGILDPKNLNPPPHADAIQPEEGQDMGGQSQSGMQDLLAPFMSNMSQFGIPGGQTATSRLPDYAAPSGANITSNLNQGLGQQGGLPPEVLAKLRSGNYSGRIQF